VILFGFEGDGFVHGWISLLCLLVSLMLMLFDFVRLMFLFLCFQFVWCVVAAFAVVVDHFEILFLLRYYFQVLSSLSTTTKKKDVFQNNEWGLRLDYSLREQSWAVAAFPCSMMKICICKLYGPASRLEVVSSHDYRVMLHYYTQWPAAKTNEATDLSCVDGLLGS